MGGKQGSDFSTPGNPLNAAFAGLNVDGLPPGESPKPEEIRPPAGPPKPGKLGRVVLRREKAHRGGKTVIVVHDFAPHIGMNYLEELSGRLKAACGCGGTAKNRTIEIQGDQPARIRALLEQEGFRVVGVS